MLRNESDIVFDAGGNSGANKVRWEVTQDDGARRVTGNTTATANEMGKWAAKAAPQRSGQPSGWCCATCTFVNSAQPARAQCEMCNSPDPSAAAPSAASEFPSLGDGGGGGSGSENAPRTWIKEVTPQDHVQSLLRSGRKTKRGTVIRIG